MLIIYILLQVQEYKYDYRSQNMIDVSILYTYFIFRFNDTEQYAKHSYKTSAYSYKKRITYVSFTGYKTNGFYFLLYLTVLRIKQVFNFNSFSHFRIFQHFDLICQIHLMKST